MFSIFKTIISSAMLMENVSHSKYNVDTTYAKHIKGCTL